MALRTPITEARWLQRFLYTRILFENKHMDFHVFPGGKCGYSIFAPTNYPKAVTIFEENAEAICQYSKIPSVTVGYQYIESYPKFGIEKQLCFVILIEVVRG